MIDNDFDTDLLIIGGGINGAGIARDAAGRGLSGATSSASTKLIHGGLRDLEHYEFGLVRAALKEREVILNAAPHIVRPLRFILPQCPGVRPNWLIRIGLFLYDHLGVRNRLPSSGAFDLIGTPYGEPLNPNLRKAAYYWDCCVDDSRLVVLNALDAAAHGAKILPRTECVCAQPNQTGNGWLTTLANCEDGSLQQVRARVVINAAGPWAESCLSDVIQGVPAPKMRLVRGSHIVVPRLFGHDSAYIFQNLEFRKFIVLNFENK